MNRRSLVTLATPLWGTLVAVPIIILGNSEALTSLIMVLGAIGVLAGAMPIARSHTLGLIDKVFLISLYLAGSAILVVLLGMALLCLHRCN
jgi:hypothetical protein